MLELAPNPAADARDDVAAQSGVPEPANKIWFQKTASAVIEAGRCTGCGGCLAACPSRSLDVATDGRPTLVRMCTGCSACWDFCPLAGLRTEPLVQALDDKGPLTAAPALGSVREAWTARSARPAKGAQDGGLVSALLAELIRQGVVGGALVTRRKNAFEAETVIATTPGEVLEAAGSIYHQPHLLRALNRPLPPGVSSLAVVGTPCQVNALRALQRFPWRYRRSAAPSVELVIGLFCTSSLDPRLLLRALTRRRVDVARVHRVRVDGGRLRALDPDGGLLGEFPAAELNAEAGLRGCDECADYSGRLADISVGGEGSPDGWTTVLVRTSAGASAWERAAAVLERGPHADLDLLAARERRNRRRAERSLPYPMTPFGPLHVSYREHLRVFGEGARAPKPVPEHRSQHYLIGC